MIPVEEGIAYFTEQIKAGNPGDMFPYVMRAMLRQDTNQIDEALTRTMTRSSGSIRATADLQ